MNEVWLYVKCILINCNFSKGNQIGVSGVTSISDLLKVTVTLEKIDLSRESLACFFHKKATYSRLKHRQYSNR